MLEIHVNQKKLLTMPFNETLVKSGKTEDYFLRFLNC
jgi:hypothetical protein